MMRQPKSDFNSNWLNLIAPKVAVAKFDFEKIEQERKFYLLQLLALALFCLASTFMLVSIILSIFMAGFPLVPVLFVCIVPDIVYTIAYWQVRQRQNYNLSAVLTIVTLFCTAIVGYILVGTAVPIGVFFLLVVFLGLVLLEKQRLTLTLAVLGTLFIIGLYVLQNLTSIYKPILTLSPQVETWLAMTNLLCGLFTTAAAVYIPLQSQLAVLRARTNYLQDTLDQLELRQQASQVVSQEVAVLAAQLTSTANQQASGSQEEVSTVAQINGSVKRLSNNADRIAQVVVEVEQATKLMTVNSQQIEQTTTTSVEQANQGLQAVNLTLQVSQKVAELYRQLLQKTEELTQRSSQMRQILQLLDAISEETHLLSLNAAIEAAGAGQYGERFGVVASEVKNLSQRSRKAGKDVVEIVEKIEHFSEELSQVAYDGSQHTNELETIAYSTGQRIGELQQVAQNAQEQANAISKRAQTVEGLTKSIHLATSEQSSASQQVLVSLSELLLVAKQGAAGSEVVASTAHTLESLANQLNTTLTSASTASS